MQRLDYRPQLTPESRRVPLRQAAELCPEGLLALGEDHEGPARPEHPPAGALQRAISEDFAHDAPRKVLVPAFLHNQVRVVWHLRHKGDPSREERIPDLRQGFLKYPFVLVLLAYGLPARAFRQGVPQASDPLPAFASWGCCKATSEPSPCRPPSPFYHRDHRGVGRAAARFLRASEARGRLEPRQR